jgi:hypothetical protein
MYIFLNALNVRMEPGQKNKLCLLYRLCNIYQHIVIKLLYGLS